MSIALRPPTSFGAVRRGGTHIDRYPSRNFPPLRTAQGSYYVSIYKHFTRNWSEEARKVSPPMIRKKRIVGEIVGHKTVSLIVR